MFWEADNGRRAFLKLAAFSLAGITAPRRAVCTRRSGTPSSGRIHQSMRSICWSRATSVTWPRSLSRSRKIWIF